MEVDGISVAAAEDIQAASVVEGFIASGTGHLILKTRGGTEIDAGQVVPDVLASWPVGSIFMNTSSTNPATLLGGGTWVRWGQGKMPVSQNSAETEFDTSEETGGAKTVTLTEAQMPVHNHTATASADGVHTHQYFDQGLGSWVNTSNTGASRAAVADEGERTTLDSGSHTHTITVANKGGGEAHPNLPPYIVVYMWKRTA